MGQMTYIVTPNVTLVASSTILLAKVAPTTLACEATSEADSASFMVGFTHLFTRNMTACSVQLSTRSSVD
jgi:hypothetical protein